MSYTIRLFKHAQGLTISSRSAFKFLPVLGKYIVDCYENKAPREIRHKWRLRRPAESAGDVKVGDGSRGGPPLRILTAKEQAKL